MGIRLVYQPPAATIAGAAEKAGAGKKQYRDQDFAEKQKQFKASMDLNWEKIDLARDEFAFRQQYASDQQQAAVVAQDKALAANAQQAQAIDARVRELAAMGIDADTAAAKAREEAATKRQEAVFTQAKGTENQRYIDGAGAEIQRIKASYQDAAKTRRAVPGDAQQTQIAELDEEYAKAVGSKELTEQQRADMIRSIVGRYPAAASFVGKAPPTMEEVLKSRVKTNPETGEQFMLQPDGEPKIDYRPPPKPTEDPSVLSAKEESTLFLGKLKTAVDLTSIMAGGSDAPPSWETFKKAWRVVETGELEEPKDLGSMDLRSGPDMFAPGAAAQGAAGPSGPADPIVYEGDQPAINKMTAPRAYERAVELWKTSGMPMDQFMATVARDYMLAKQGNAAKIALLKKHGFWDTELRL